MERVLLVIEDDHVATILRTILSAELPADAMATVHSGNEAVVYLRQHSVNGLVMEAGAQILDRFSLQTLIQHRYPALPIVVLGGAAGAGNGSPALAIVPAPFSVAAAEEALLRLVAQMRLGANAPPPAAAPPSNGHLPFADDELMLAAGGELAAIIAADGELAAASSADPPPARLLVADASPDGAGDQARAALAEAPAATPLMVGRTDAPMATFVRDALAAAMEIEGALGVALVDYQNGTALGARGDGTLDLELAAAGNSDVIRAKMRVMASLGLGDTIEDMLITLGAQYHVIRLLRASPGLFMYLVLNRDQANLAMARHRLSHIEATLNP